jgi:hypothetical protein
MSKSILSSPELKAALRKALGEGTLRFTDHALKQMDKRQITQPQVERVLRTGTHDERNSGYQNGQWRYRLTGKTVLGRTLHVAVEITEGVVVVTVMGD